MTKNVEAQAKEEAEIKAAFSSREEIINWRNYFERDTE